MKVTVCVNALQPQLSGIGRYTLELCRGLRRHDEVAALQFYGGHSLIDDPEALLRRPQRLQNSRPFHHLRNKFTRWRTRRALHSSIVHGPNYFLPSEAETGIITVHDLSVFRYPEMHPPERLAAFERMFHSSLQRASHLITDSETVRKELVDLYSLAPEGVSVVPLGVDPKFRPVDASQIEASLAEWGLKPGRYGLSVAAFEPRKKLPELITAWRDLSRFLRDSYPLVLAGYPGWRNEALLHDISAGSAEGWLKFLGYVDEDRLPSLYAGARLFVYPSIYEGFGLPPIEAMACGTPVIVSERSCLPEVCGKAAALVDPDDHEALTSAIQRGLTDEHWRSEMTSRGLSHAKQFTWGRCVEKTVDVYATVAAQID